MAAQILLRPCPASGEGVHRWIFYAACTLVEMGLSNEEAEAEIEALNDARAKSTKRNRGCAPICARGTQTLNTAMVVSESRCNRGDRKKWSDTT